MVLRVLTESTNRMKKSPVPEIRMTEAALKRQAKIKQDKEKPLRSTPPTTRSASVSTGPYPLRRPLSTRITRSTSNAIAMNNNKLKEPETSAAKARAGAKKAKIEEHSPTLIRRVKSKENALRNSPGLSSNNKPISKAGSRDRIPSSTSSTSRVSSKKVDHAARAKLLESRVEELEAKLKDVTNKLTRADELVTIIFPSVLKQKDQQIKMMEEAALEKVAELTSRAALEKAVNAEQIAKLQQEHSSSLADLNARIAEQTTKLSELSNQLSESQNEQNQLKTDISNRDSIIAEFPKRLEKLAKENDKKISEEVERRLKPYVEAKNLADSMKFENEEKAKQNKILRQKNNQIVLENEQFREEIEKLSKFKHIAEDRSEMIENIKNHNRRLQTEVETVRQRLSAVEAEKNLLNCSLDEEKFRSETGHRRLSTSFVSSHECSTLDETVFHSFNESSASP
ncbi:Oidioi.mRNA.OKI2018_I69.PAR.g12037.t1.cds [Oikopleura dioica]|uniref:Oidioi.mRNA.OKI2018_I69.PAR.g12037.t1.cds n=1 Tax=Oikopleura dioica TaxID=34765 RepID=A0ABN7S582_OIKDI|nr:Oidioi.mRNA.OKI2018_I69.PAR.g12037.t1.cds [Oikopleura dioica]